MTHRRAQVPMHPFEVRTSFGRTHKSPRHAVKSHQYCDEKVATTLFEQLFELFSAGFVFSSKLFELIRVVVIFVVVIWWAWRSPRGPSEPGRCWRPRSPTESEPEPNPRNWVNWCTQLNLALVNLVIIWGSSSGRGFRFHLVTLLVN